MTPTPMHVERTGDPSVLRWVCHCPDLGAPGVRCPPDSAVGDLAVLHHQREIVGIRTIDGDLLVTAPPSSSWSSLAPRVHDAIVAELATTSSLASWLTIAPAAADHFASSAMAMPTIGEVQAVVDRAAGAVASSHGGRIEVVSVHDDGVRVVLHGACHGCSGANTTLNELVHRAVIGRWPHLTTLTDEAPARPSVVPVLLARRRTARVVP